jgi:hypothetical protein
MTNPNPNDDQPTPTIREWLTSLGTSLTEIREYSRHRASLLQGLQDAIKHRINGPLQVMKGTSDATSLNKP